MLEWINQTMESPTVNLAVLPAAFLLGVLGAATSCCSLAAIGAIAGYSASEAGSQDRRKVLLSSLFFMLGTTAALTVLGAITGLVSQAIGSQLGQYWKFFAGFVMVFFGLAVLNLLPFKLPRFGARAGAAPRSTIGAMLYGFAIGGGITACTVGCNPALFMALGIATLKGRTLWGAVIMVVFALGFSLPLAGAALGLGLGFSKLSGIARKSGKVVKIAAGVLLIGVGIYLLSMA